MTKNCLPFFIVGFLFTMLTSNRASTQEDSARIRNIEAAFPAIDTLFSQFAKQNHIPGLVYGLIVEGKLIYTGNIGHANIAQKIPADNKSSFRIASMTKSFTAMAILKLRDEGKLKLDDPAYLYIPGMKEQKDLATDAAPVTIRNLLTHAAGFPEDNPWGDRQLARTDAEMLSMIRKGISFSNVPGVKYEYSNMGFAMLGFIIKKVSGLSYDVYITKNILEPLGMKNTYFEYSKVPPNTLALGYRWVNEQWLPQPLLHDGIYGAMGGMITSIEDFGKYASLQLSAWPPRSDEDKGPIKRSSLREMQFPWNISAFNSKYVYPGGRPCPIVSAYAYGLGWTRDCEGRVYVGHSGGLPGFGSNWRIMPDYGIGIISFGNLTYAPASLINMQVLDTLITMAKLQPKQLQPSAILNKRKNELIRLLPEWKNAAKIPIFAENFFMDYFPDSLRKEAMTIFKNAGKIVKVGELIPENNLRGSFIMEGEHNDIEISFTLTPENPPLIQEYRISTRKKNDAPESK